MGGLQIIVDAQFKKCVTVHRVRTGMAQLEDAPISDCGVHGDGTRWYIFSSPWHYKTKKNDPDSPLRPVRRLAKNKFAMATLEIPSVGPARIHYTTEMDVMHEVKYN